MRRSVLLASFVLAVALALLLVEDRPRGSTPGHSPSPEESESRPGASPLPNPDTTSEARRPQPFHRVTTTDGVPVEDAEVRWVELAGGDLAVDPVWREDDWGPLERNILRTRSDSGGFFAFEQDPTAEFGALLCASKPGFVAGLRFVPPGEPLGREPRVLTLDASPTTVVRVVDAAGEPVGEATVHQYGIVPRWIPTDSGDARTHLLLRRLLEARAVTGPDGTARCAAFPGDQVFVASTASTCSRPWRGASRERVELVLQDGFTVGGTLTLPAGSDSHAEGRRILIVCKVGGVSRTLVTLRGVEEGAWGPLLVPDLPRAEYAAQFEGAPLFPTVRAFESPGVGGHVTLDLRGELGAELTFQALNELGDVLNDAEVLLKWTQGDTRCRQRHRAGDDGMIHCRGVASGSIAFEIGAPGYRTHLADVEVQVPQDPVETIRRRLDPAGSLRGVVLCAGDPVPDFTLWAWNRDVPGNALSRTFIDREDGAFLWDELPIGEVWLTATGEEAVANAPLALQVEREAGEPVVIELPRSLSGAGRLVSGSTGVAIEGGTVEACRLVGNGAPAASQGRRVRTGADGSFEVEGFGPGRNWVFTTAPGHAEEMVPVDVRLEEGSPVRVGTIRLWTEQTLTVELVGPADGFDPTPYTVDIGTGDPPQAIDREGRALFEAVRPGQTRVSLKRPQGGWISIDVDMPAGRDLTLRHRIDLDRRLLLEVEPVEGYDASGGFSAYVLYDDPRGGRVVTGLPLNALGVTSLEGIEGDRVLVKVLRKGDWAVVGTARGSFGGRNELHLVARAGENLLTVRVVDRDGAPVPGAEVGYGQPGPPPLALTAMTDGDGRAHLHATSDAGVIRVEHADVGTLEALPWPGGPGEVEVRLVADAAIELLVRDGAGPLADAKCNTTWMRGYRLGPTKSTDAAGRVRFEDLTPGKACVRVTHHDHWPREVVVPAATSPEPVVVVLPALGDLVLRLVDSGDVPLAGVEIRLESVELGESVSLWLDAGRVRGSLRTDRAGEARLQGLPEGEYEWSADGPARGRLRVMPGTRTEVDLR